MALSINIAAVLKLMGAHTNASRQLKFANAKGNKYMAIINGTMTINGVNNFIMPDNKEN